MRGMIKEGLLRGTYPDDSDDIIVGVTLKELRKAVKECSDLKVKLKRLESK